MASLRKKGKVWYVRVRDESGRQREVKAGPLKLPGQDSNLEKQDQNLL